MVNKFDNNKRIIELEHNVNKLKRDVKIIAECIEGLIKELQNERS